MELVDAIRRLRQKARDDARPLPRQEVTLVTYGDTILESTGFRPLEQGYVPLDDVGYVVFLGVDASIALVAESLSADEIGAAFSETYKAEVTFSFQTLDGGETQVINPPSDTVFFTEATGEITFTYKWEQTTGTPLALSEPDELTCIVRGGVPAPSDPHQIRFTVSASTGQSVSQIANLAFDVGEGAP